MSFRVTSSKSIQKHRATCVAHHVQPNSSNHQSAEQHTPHSHDKARRKRERCQSKRCSALLNQRFHSSRELRRHLWPAIVYTVQLLSILVSYMLHQYAAVDE